MMVLALALLGAALWVSGVLVGYGIKSVQDQNKEIDEIMARIDALMRKYGLDPNNGP